MEDWHKMNSNNKEQSLIRKTENLLDSIYDNFDAWKGTDSELRTT